MTIKRPLTAKQQPIEYPESDGKPMAETPVHRDWLIWFIQVLQDRYADRPDVYVSGNMMMYYEEGNPHASVSPDVFVTIGVPKLPERRVYLIWAEAPPTVVFEMTSRSTRSVDLRRKRELYARLGVQEYFLYDPLSEYLRPPLQGLTLVDGEYHAIEPDAEGALLSTVLGLRLLLADGQPRLLDAVTGRQLLGPRERAAAAERELAELRRLLAERGRNGGQASGSGRA